MHFKIWVATLVIGLTIGGCGQPTENFPSQAISPRWVRISNPSYIVKSFFPLVTPVNTSTCPSISVEGDNYTIQGGCVSDTGIVYEGRVRGTMIAGTRYFTVHYENYTSSLRRVEHCNGVNVSYQDNQRINGIISTTGSGSTFQFDVDMSVSRNEVSRENCQVQQLIDTIRYNGSVEHSGMDGSDADFLGDTELWAGQGRLDNALLGQADVQTVGELMNPSVCETEPLSGLLTITSGAHTAVVSFDGATNCENHSVTQSPMAPWTVNGQPAGAVPLYAF